MPPHFEHFPPFLGNTLAPARSLPALPAHTTHPWPDVVKAISVATNFIMQIINISQNRTKYATTTNNFFHTQLTAATRYTQRTTTNTAPIPSPPTPVWPLIFSSPDTSLSHSLSLVTLFDVLHALLRTRLSPTPANVALSKLTNLTDRDRVSARESATR